MSRSRRRKSPQLDPKDRDRLLKIAEQQTGLKHLKLYNYSPGTPGKTVPTVFVLAGNNWQIGYFKYAYPGGGENFVESRHRNKHQQQRPQGRGQRRRRS